MSGAGGPDPWRLGELADPLPVAPFPGPVDARVTLPGSKSITNRALVCAALASGRSTLRGILRADDTEVMLSALGALGAAVTIDETDPTVARVDGIGGRIRGGTEAAPLRLDALLSGTTSRFLLGVAALADGFITIDGAEPLRARPMRDGLDALTRIGAGVVASGDGLPATIRGIGSSDAGGGDRRSVSVGAAASSQFLSALLLAAPCAPGGLRIVVDGEIRSWPYVEMTVAVMASFGAGVDLRRGPDGVVFDVDPGGYHAVAYRVEPDASAASYAFAVPALVGGRVVVEGLGSSSLQGDLRMVDVLAEMGAAVDVGADDTVVAGTAGALHGVRANLADLSDTAQTVAAVAVFASSATVIDGIGFIRRKETDRIAAVVTELRRCGIGASELDDGIEIRPGSPRPAAIETYHDHRMAMAFALLGLRSPGIAICDPSCVSKTFPGYWRMLDDLRSTCR